MEVWWSSHSRLSSWVAHLQRMAGCLLKACCLFLQFAAAMVDFRPVSDSRADCSSGWLIDRLSRSSSAALFFVLHRNFINVNQIGSRSHFTHANSSFPCFRSQMGGRSSWLVCQLSILATPLTHGKSTSWPFCPSISVLLGFLVVAQAVTIAMPVAELSLFSQTPIFGLDYYPCLRLGYFCTTGSSSRCLVQLFLFSFVVFVQILQLLQSTHLIGCGMEMIWGAQTINCLFL